ncbi:MAG: HAD family phosphatase [Stomatobaculum sp.]|nr:HAD family phosphatase [Stomatobaculum sp.]
MKKTLKPFKAVLFDMDGIILDTERVHILGWHAVFGDIGIVPEEEFLVSLRGANTDFQRKQFQEKFHGTVDYQALRNARRNFCQQYYKEHGLPVKEGYRELSAWLKEKGIPKALCSSTTLETIVDEFRIAGIPFDFDASVTGTEPEHSKPAPDVFLLGADKLGIRPEDCIVFEDSPNGVKAGHAAGCQVIMVPDTVPPTEELRSLSTAVCGSLLEAMELLVTIQGYD